MSIVHHCNCLLYLCLKCVGSVSVDILPGANDPASGILPQQPLHKCMFPQVKKFGKKNPKKCVEQSYLSLFDFPLPLERYDNTSDVTG